MNDDFKMRMTLNGSMVEEGCQGFLDGLVLGMDCETEVRTGVAEAVEGIFLRPRLLLYIPSSLAMPLDWGNTSSRSHVSKRPHVDLT